MFLRGDLNIIIEAVRIVTSAALMSVVSFSKEVPTCIDGHGFSLSLHLSVSHFPFKAMYCTVTSQARGLSRTRTRQLVSMRASAVVRPIHNIHTIR